MMERTDEQLVSDYLDGDEQALSVLVDRYTDELFNFITQYTGRRDEAADILQETFVRAWKNFGKFDGKRKFRVWIYTLARNASIDWLRKRHTIAISAFDDEDDRNSITDTLADDEPRAEELFFAAEKKGVLGKAVETLPEKYKTVLFMRFQSELSIAEISETLGMSQNTVKTQYRRALGMLKKTLENEPKLKN